MERREESLPVYRRSIILRGGEVIDCVSARFGCRTFEIDPEKGFILNGKEYPLRGVSRHQDHWGIGNALLPEHHIEDIDLICEMGANTISLAHYQHNQLFLDLFMILAKKQSGPKKKNPDKKAKKKKNPEMNSGIMNMIRGFTVLRFTGMLGMRSISFTKEELLKMNRQLNHIRKPK